MATTPSLFKLADNWTLAVFVPDQTGVFEAKKHGFPSQNISVWDATSAKGVQEVGTVMQQATENYLSARSRGIRGTKTLFSMDTTQLSTTTVKNTLTELKCDVDYTLLNVSKKIPIKTFVESWKMEYRLGSAYFQLTKPVKVQGHKQVCVQEKRTAKVYGGSAARKLLGLPDHEVEVGPASHPDFDLFVQSTSPNRSLVPGTKLLVMK
jgi:hypothetical protein